MQYLSTHATINPTMCQLAVILMMQSQSSIPLSSGTAHEKKK